MGLFRNFRKLKQFNTVFGMMPMHALRDKVYHSHTCTSIHNSVSNLCIKAHAKNIINKEILCSM